MLDRLTGKSVHLFVHLFSCSLIAAGLPTSKIPLSLGTMLIILNLFLEADFKSYWKNLTGNKIAIGLWVFLGVELLSLIWTSDFNYAAHDLRVKLPLLAIPVALVAKPVTERKQLYLLLGLFMAALFATSFINFGSYQHWWGNKVYDDIRGMSLFNSHIRYGLMIGMGIALSIAWFTKELPYRFIAVVLFGWWVWYTWYAQIISGYVAVITVFMAGILLLLLVLRMRWVKWSIIGTTLFIAIAGSWWLIDFFQPTPHKIKIDNPEKYTVNGHWYRHEFKDVIWENGYPVVYYLSEEELEKEWNKRSEIDYKTGRDLKQQPLFYTLWRYMASKGLRKDSLGFQSMTAADIANVEHGHASIKLAQDGIEARLYSIKHQLEYPANPNGHSLLQRMEYWKAGYHIILDNWITGVGSGDVQQAFRDYYASSNTALLPELQLRAHNQYMTSWISSGIAGLLAFLLWWWLFLRFAWKERIFEVLCFAGIALGSFLTEDTLETQMGITFVAFFFGLFAGSGLLLKTRSKP